MKNIYLNIYKPNLLNLKKAKKSIENNEVIGIPTETVYGLAGNAYSKKLSVSPITTHIPLKKVAKNITKEKIISNVIQINKFYMKVLRKKPNIAILGLNPHCETIDCGS